jgi:hypothetical protein
MGIIDQESFIMSRPGENSCEQEVCLTGVKQSDYTLSSRGVAQLVAHRVWDAGVGGSSPPTPTSSKVC